jgi:lysophospholipase L1-like esterase
MGKAWHLAASVLLALLVGIASGYWIQGQRAASLTMHWSAIGRANRLNQFNAMSSRAQVAMLGDSLTEQGEWSELLGEVTANRGFGGDTARQLLARVSSVPVAAKTVFVMVGINDIVAHRRPSDVASDTRRIVEALSLARSLCSRFCSPHGPI